VSRALRILAAGVVGLVVAGMPVACGSDGDDGGREAAPGAEVRPPRLVTGDRRAYTRIQRASGDLRAAAIPVSYGASEIVAADRLRADIRTLEVTEPQDSLLKRLRRRTLRALRTASAAGQGDSAQAAAAAAIAEADRIDAGLRRYAASNPAANEIAPG
jgi:hypothetical protein